MINKTHEEFEINEDVTNHSNIHPDLENKIENLEKKIKELEEKQSKTSEIVLEK